MFMYKRILLKMSGEALKGNDGFGINPKTVTSEINSITMTFDALSEDLYVAVRITEFNPE